MLRQIQENTFIVCHYEHALVQLKTLKHAHDKPHAIGNSTYITRIQSNLVAHKEMYYTNARGVGHLRSYSYFVHNLFEAA